MSGGCAISPWRWAMRCVRLHSRPTNASLFGPRCVRVPPTRRNWCANISTGRYWKKEGSMELTEAIDEKPAQELLSSTASIDMFCDALWLEHGLAKNSLEAYRRDLKLFAQWLSKTRGGTVDTATEADMNGYMAARRADKATSANRRLSVFRRYYAWAMREHRVLG